MCAEQEILEVQKMRKGRKHCTASRTSRWGRSGWRLAGAFRRQEATPESFAPLVWGRPDGLMDVFDQLIKSKPPLLDPIDEVNVC